MRTVRKCTSESPAGPVLVVVKVRISAEHGEEGMSQGTSLAVEGVPVPVGAILEADVDVNAPGRALSKCQVGVFRPAGTDSLHSTTNCAAHNVQYCGCEFCRKAGNLQA